MDKKKKNRLNGIKILVVKAVIKIPLEKTFKISSIYSTLVKNVLAYLQHPKVKKLRHVQHVYLLATTEVKIPIFPHKVIHNIPSYPYLYGRARIMVSVISNVTYAALKTKPSTTC